MTLPRSILLAALVVGIAADALRPGFDGLGFPLWTALLVLAAVALAWRDDRVVPREAAAWLAIAVLASAGIAWRTTGELQALDFLATLLALGLAAVTLGQPEAGVLRARLRDTLWAGVRVLRDVFVGALPLTFRELVASGSPGTRRRAWPMVRTVLIVIALVAVFGSLLRGADPLFASLLTIPDFDFGLVIEHVLVIGFFAWVFAGWSRGAFISPATAGRAPERLPVSLGLTDMTAALVTLDVMFALFVLAQLGWLFGGDAFLQAHTGLTAAEYARRGFFQLVFVVLLVVPLLMAMRTLLFSGAETARRYVRLAIPMVILLVAMLLSAVLRMRLYVKYFGLTTSRFYTLAIMAWLAFVLVWFAFTTLRDRDQHFVAGAVLAGYATLFLLNAVVPDRVVARVNLARAQRPVAAGGVPLDVAYLATLSGDAIDLILPATLAPPPNSGEVTRPAADGTVATSPDAQRCIASRRLLRRWGPASRDAARQEEPAAWRGWNAGERRALSLVARQARALRAVEHDACAAARAAGVRVAGAAAYR